MASAKLKKKEYTQNPQHKKTPYSKVLLRQTAAAVICFFVLKYLCGANIILGFEKKLKQMTDESTPFEQAIKNANAAELKSFLNNAVSKILNNGENKNEEQKNQRKTDIIFQ